MELKGSDLRPRRMRIFRCAGLACAFAVLGALLANGPVSCTGTEVPDPDEALFGTVTGKDGHPAQGARVIAWAQADALKRAEADSSLRVKDTVYTDTKGYYAFKEALVEGHYNLYFEDSLSDRSARMRERKTVLYDSTNEAKLDVKLSPPSQLVLTVKDYDTQGSIQGAECIIEDSPYRDTTGKEGIVLFFPPAGQYTVACYYTPPHLTPLRYTLSSLDLQSGSQRQETVFLYPNGIKPDPLPPPESLSVRYDENSGFARLSWPPVNDPRLFEYGLGRVNIDSGGGATERPVVGTEYPDVVFDPGDSVQLKNLLYSISSHKSNASDNAGSRRSYARLSALRPWAYGARIDSLTAVPRDSAYRAGDTVRFAAFWTNRMRENDTLYWWIQGGADLRALRANPPAKGSDTLSVVLPAAGEYKVNLTIRDAEGYRSWLSIPFRL